MNACVHVCVSLSLTLSSTASVSRLKREAIALMRSGLKVPSARMQDRQYMWLGEVKWQGQHTKQDSDVRVCVTCQVIASRCGGA